MMRVRFTSSPDDSAAREAIPVEDTLEYFLIDGLDGWRLGVPGEEIQDGRPQLVSWIVFRDVEQSIYTFDRSTLAHPTRWGVLPYHRGQTPCG